MIHIGPCLSLIQPFICIYSYVKKPFMVRKLYMGAIYAQRKSVPLLLINQSPPPHPKKTPKTPLRFKYAYYSVTVMIHFSIIIVDIRTRLKIQAFSFVCRKNFIYYASLPNDLWRPLDILLIYCSPDQCSKLVVQKYSN